jgi:LSD1 subclass zinc finger protein
MQVICDGCKKALRIPDTAAGKKVRCPMCQAVFTALPLMEIGPTSPATAITTTPSPVPFSPEKITTPPPVPAERRRPRDDDYDDEEPRIERSDRAQSRQQEYLRSGGFWLLLSGIYFVVYVAFNIISTFLILPVQPAIAGNRNNPTAIMVGMVCGACLWFIPAIFILVGSYQMRSARSRGLVITGVVFDFIMCAVMLVGLMCNVFSLAALPGRIVLVITIQILLAAGGVTLGIIAGVKTLVLLGKPEVKAAFGIRSERARDYDDDDDEEWERRRRRRRRDGGED